jgi:hypothetical protein
LAIVTTVFNVSLLHASLNASLPGVSLPNFEKIRDDISSALDWLEFPYFAMFFEWVQQYLGWLDFVSSIGLSW